MEEIKMEKETWLSAILKSIFAIALPLLLAVLAFIIINPYGELQKYYDGISPDADQSILNDPTISDEFKNDLKEYRRDTEKYFKERAESKIKMILIVAIPVEAIVVITTISKLIKKREAERIPA